MMISNLHIYASEARPRIPAHAKNGLLPPFVGDQLCPDLRSPFQVSTLQLVERYAVTYSRCKLLRGYLAHRAELHKLGITCGHQWISGSFVDEKKEEPADIDVVTFYLRPENCTKKQFEYIQLENSTLFDQRQAKEKFGCDASFACVSDLNPFQIVAEASRWYALFGHTRDHEWRGFVEVPLHSPDDDASALEIFSQLEA